MDLKSQQYSEAVLILLLESFTPFSGTKTFHTKLENASFPFHTDIHFIYWLLILVPSNECSINMHT